MDQDHRYVLEIFGVDSADAVDLILVTSPGSRLPSIAGKENEEFGSLP